MPYHDIAWLQVAIADFESTVKILEENYHLRGIDTHNFHRQTNILGDESTQRPVRYVLHHEEKAVFVL